MTDRMCCDSVFRTTRMFARKSARPFNDCATRSSWIFLAMECTKSTLNSLSLTGKRHPKGNGGLKFPERAFVARTIRLRNTFLAADMKRRYNNCCQVCRIKLQLTRCTYSESHHMKPIGAPHFGPDTAGNIVVVCPNHHTMLDRGAVRIDPCSLLVEHITGSFPPCPLLLHPGHVLNRSYLRYHAESIYGRY